MLKLTREQLKAILPTPLLNLRFSFHGAPLAYRPGHFYSPICDPSALERYYRDPDQTVFKTIDGIDLREQTQQDLWKNWRPYLLEFPFSDDAPKDGDHYFCNNRFFGVGDALVLYCMLREFRPRRVIEIGSGFSSACMLDTIRRHDLPTRCTFVEPHPQRLYSLLGSNVARHEMIAKPIQDVPLTIFDQLTAGDILFIDSTHVVKTGSDVVFELFEILPRLNPGVIIHFHDIFYPFEYPREWVVNRNYSWNEIYAVRAFLMNNSALEVLFFNDYFAKFARHLVERDAPRMIANPGAGLWLRRSGAPAQ